MNAEKRIKTQAREILKNGNWCKAVGALTVAALFVLLIYLFRSFLVFILLNGGSASSGEKLTFDKLSRLIAINTSICAVSIVLSPIANGFLKLYFNIANKGREVFDVIFYYFGSRCLYAKAILFNMRLVLRFFPCIFLFMLTFVLFLNGSAQAVALGCISVLLFIAVLIFTVQRYFLSVGLFLTDEQGYSKEYFKASAAMMKNYRKSVTRLIFSFTGWIALSILILPLIYAVPYMTMSLCVCSKWIIITENSRSEAAFCGEQPLTSPDT